MTQTTFSEPDWTTPIEMPKAKLLPEGVYKCCVTDAAHQVYMDEPSLNVELTVIEGDYKNRKIWKNYRFSNPNAEYAAKSYMQFRQLCTHLGENISPNEPHRLKQRVVMVDIGEFPAGKNCIKGFSDDKQTNGAAKKDAAPLDDSDIPF